ncbi:hypothetical protein A2Z33_04825 [Candidatus Gottesmanbacteria bacterium RBG_16_52_11]|uniref:Diacylglycerol kinase n=1 Tax=Candidatus Gottesmanbacteria bacterium RBG_16_52_11 TaxID=1798374 RepID=A0A1F5YV67_9BACT|nr:MAG: hypothetical protein A2Z33_04825 [Candidatus Gottesmanbacteria bacterium RBG_16_52_11]
MREVLKRHHISFRNAMAGIVWSFRSQPNFRVHAVLALSALTAGFLFQISAVETAVIVFTILLGLTVEMINTSIEAMTDLITSEWHKDAKTAKDVSAGMMLIVATGAVIVALVIFGPRILALFE